LTKYATEHGFTNTKFYIEIIAPSLIQINYNFKNKTTEKVLYKGFFSSFAVLETYLKAKNFLLKFNTRFTFFLKV